MIGGVDSFNRPSARRTGGPEDVAGPVDFGQRGPMPDHVWVLLD
jgi:hypothetical protein